MVKPPMSNWPRRFAGPDLGNNSVEAVRGIVARMPPPPGVKAYVTGPAAIAADMAGSGNKDSLLNHGGKWSQ